MPTGVIIIGQEEHHPEERAARQVLRAQEGEPEADARTAPATPMPT